MKFKFILTLIILSVVTITNASNTIIKGSSKNFVGKEVVVSTYKDYISKEDIVLGYTTVDSEGNYSFEFDLKHTKKITLKIEDKTTWFFTEPGKVYNINLSYNPELNKGRIYDKELSLIFNFPSPNELNQQIKKFNQKFDDFINDNIVLLKKRDRSIEPKLKAFKTKILQEFESAKSTFLNNYILYTFASTQNSLDVSYTNKTNNATTKNTKANIYLEYLHEKPINYYNPEYIYFFKDFFGGELKDLTLNIGGLDITSAINDKASFDDLSIALSKYPFLENDEFKNLFILNGLFEISKDKYFDQNNIIKILKYIEVNSNYQEQKIIAKNVLKKITTKRFGKGSEAPFFKLKNQKGELVSLESFKGKPVYINFWTNWSIPSQKEMKIIQTLQKEYKNKIHFVSICADNDFEKMITFLNKNESFNWNFLHIGSNTKLLEKYSVMTYPTYVILDKNLIVYQFPAARPGGNAERATELNIEKIFYDMTK